MKPKYFLLLLFFCSVAFLAFGQSIDSLPPAGAMLPAAPGDVPQAEMDTYDDLPFTIGFATITMAFFVVFIFLVIAGLLLAALLLTATAGLAFLGILSVSFMAGLYKRSFEKGFKMFVLLCFSGAGALLCGPVAIILNRIGHWTSGETAGITGLVIGLFSGYVAGSLAFGLLRYAAGSAAKRLLPASNY